MTEDQYSDYSFDFYDYEAVEKLHQSRAKKYISLIKKWSDAKKKNDPTAMRKAYQAMAKHKERDEVLKEKCSKSGYCWY